MIIADQKAGVGKTAPAQVLAAELKTLGIDLDPFYSEGNIHYLEQKMADYKAGRIKAAEHELIEE